MKKKKKKIIRRKEMVDVACVGGTRRGRGRGKG